MKRKHNFQHTLDLSFTCLHYLTSIDTDTNLGIERSFHKTPPSLVDVRY